MACVVTDKCLDCKTRDCLPVCPINCFFETDGRMVYASQDECFECLCCYMACPVEAIYIEAALPEEMLKWKEINAEACRSPGATRLGQKCIDFDKGERSYVAGRCAATALLGAKAPAKAAVTALTPRPAAPAGGGRHAVSGSGPMTLVAVGYSPG